MYRLRFLFLIIRCLITSPVELLSKRKLRFLALPFIDTDVTRVFTHSYSIFMALARWDLMFGSEFRPLAIKNKWVPITTAETITYRRSIQAFERFEVVTEIVHWDEQRFYIEHRFMCKGKLCLRALVEGMIRGPDGVIGPQEMFTQTGDIGQLPEISEQLHMEIEALQHSSKFTKELALN